MPAQRFLNLVNGVLTQIAAIATSAGAGDADKIPCLDATGKLDNSFMPAGLGTDQFTLNASEALSAGDFVNVWNDAGTAKVRKADASNGRRADGFVLAAVTSGNPATVYTADENTGLSGMTIGARQYLGTSGARTETVPTTAGHIVQYLGVARSATALVYEVAEPVTLA
jgi:hypothetical protein